MSCDKAEEEGYREWWLRKVCTYVLPQVATVMYSDKLQLLLPTGVSPYIEVVNELLLLTQSHQRKGTKK